jgi:hypothetical protein
MWNERQQRETERLESICLQFLCADGRLKVSAATPRLPGCPCSAWRSLANATISSAPSSCRSCTSPSWVSSWHVPPFARGLGTVLFPIYTPKLIVRSTSNATAAFVKHSHKVSQHQRSIVPSGKDLVPSLHAFTNKAALNIPWLRALSSKSWVVVAVVQESSSLR